MPRPVAPGAGPDEELHRVGHLVERRARVDAVRVEERLVRAVLPGERAGVRGDHRLGSLGPARPSGRSPGTSRSAAAPAPSRNPSGSRTVSRSRAITRVRRQRQRVVHVVGDVGRRSPAPTRRSTLNPIPRSLNASAANAEPEWLMNVDVAAPHAVGRGEPRRAQAGLEVEEPHPVAAAHRASPRRGRSGRRAPPAGAARARRLASKSDENVTARARAGGRPHRGAPAPRAGSPRRGSRGRPARGRRRSTDSTASP